MIQNSTTTNYVSYSTEPFFNFESALLQQKDLIAASYIPTRTFSDDQLYEALRTADQTHLHKTKELLFFKVFERYTSLPDKYFGFIEKSLFSPPKEDLAVTLITAAPLSPLQTIQLYELACINHRFCSAKALIEKLLPIGHALHIACKYTFLELVQYIAIIHPDFLTPGTNQTSPLHWIGLRSKNLREDDFLQKVESIITFLSNQNINVSEKDVYGATAFHYACLRGDIETVNFLEKIDPSSQKYLGQGICKNHFLAIAWANNSSIQYETLYNFTEKDLQKRTPLHYAFSLCENLLAKPVVLDIKRLFLENPELFEEKDDFNNTPADILLQRGVNIHSLQNSEVSLLDLPEDSTPDCNYEILLNMRSFVNKFFWNCKSLTDYRSQNSSSGSTVTQAPVNKPPQQLPDPRQVAVIAIPILHETVREKTQETLQTIVTSIKNPKKFE